MNACLAALPPVKVGSGSGRRFTDSIAVGRVSQPESDGDRKEGEGTLRGRTE